MNKQKTPPLYRPRRSARQWLADARRCAVGEVKARPLFYALRAVVISVFAMMAVNQVAATGKIVPFWLGCAVFFLSLTLLRLLRGMYGPAQEVKQWALEEQERITMMSLTGKNQEELEKLLAYHMKYGNIEEADRISQKLLLMVEKETAAASGQASAAAPATGDPGQSQPAQGLPGWLKDEENASQAQAGKKLPDWMNG